MDEIKKLLKEFVKTRDLLKKTNSPEMQKKYKKLEELCVEKFKYIITIRTSRYKEYSNYEDLNQEGMEALLKALNNYDPKKGDFYWWAHKYIDTRISRCANLHTTIRYPLQFSKKNPPRRDYIFPTMIEKRNNPEKETENNEIAKILEDASKKLNNEQLKIIIYLFGLDGGKPMTVNKICEKTNFSRTKCIKTIKNALTILRKNIKI